MADITRRAAIYQINDFLLRYEKIIIACKQCRDKISTEASSILKDYESSGIHEIVLAALENPEYFSEYTNDELYDLLNLLMRLFENSGLDIREEQRYTTGVCDTMALSVTSDILSKTGSPTITAGKKIHYKVCMDDSGEEIQNGRNYAVSYEFRYLDNNDSLTSLYNDAAIRYDDIEDSYSIGLPGTYEVTGYVFKKDIWGCQDLVDTIKFYQQVEAGSIQQYNSAKEGPVDYFNKVLRQVAIRLLADNCNELNELWKKYDTLSIDGDNVNWDEVIQKRKAYEQAIKEQNALWLSLRGWEQTLSRGYCRPEVMKSYSEVALAYNNKKAECAGMIAACPEIQFIKISDLQNGLPGPKIFNKMREGFESVAEAQTSLYGKIISNDISLWKIDPVVQKTFEVLLQQDFTDDDIDLICEYLKHEKVKDFAITLGLTTLTLVTGIALFFVTGGAATALSIAAGVGLSAVEVAADLTLGFKEAGEAQDTLDLTYAGTFGEKLTDLDIHTAEYENTMAIAGLVMSILDFTDVASALKAANRYRKMSKETLEVLAKAKKGYGALNSIDPEKLEKFVSRFDPDVAAKLISSKNADEVIQVYNVVENGMSKEFISKILKLENADEIIILAGNKIEYIKYLNNKTIEKITNSSDIKESLELIIKQNEEIVRKGNEKAYEILKTASSKTSAGPCLSTVYDPELNQYFYGQNFKKGTNNFRLYENWIDNEADEIIRNRYKPYKMEVDDNIVVLPESADLRLAGHSEVRALNELIEARRKAGLPVSDEMIDNIYIYNVDLRHLFKENEIIPKPRCVNCSRLTSGANTILHE